MVGKSLEIILVIVSACRRLAGSIRAFRNQRDSDFLHKDPGGWLDAHFPGELHDERRDPKEPASQAADKRNDTP
jgi:hypothetical protein